MGTPYSDIIKLALTSIQDYKLDALYKRSEADWFDYLVGFMIRGLSNFDNCMRDLSKRDDELYEFYDCLTMEEQSIIADYTVLSWLDKEIFDVRQITGMMQNGREAQRLSEANLLDKKILLKNATLEQVDGKKVGYSLKNVDWSTWN